MNQQQLSQHILHVAALMRREAFRWTFDGRMTEANMARLSSSTFDDDLLALRLMFTRDVGHHTSGWMKNPEFEQCLHLSVSPVALAPGSTVDRDPPKHVDRVLVPVFFGHEGARLAWCEGPKTPEGKSSRVRHWRVFCNEVWEPISPRGEVYSTELTERGWKTASELGITTDSPLSL